MHPSDSEDHIARFTTNRRKLLFGVAGTGIVAAGALITPVTRVLGADKGSDDESDKDDHSGHGGGDDDDDDADHSGHDDDDHSGQEDDDDTVQVQGDIPAGSVEIRIVEDHPGGFVPSPLTIDAGQTVTFVNLHDEAHTATGSDFDTGIIQPGGTASVTFDTAGTFNYACQIHPEMTGTIVVRSGDGTPAASPEAATPAASPVGGNEFAVTIVNIAFDPAALTVPVGATVTWTNEDQVPHTATGIDRNLLQSGTIQPGQQFSKMFDTAGTIEYFCEFHANMKGTIIVQ
jgi:plastocyanin